MKAYKVYAECVTGYICDDKIEEFFFDREVARVKFEDAKRFVDRWCDGKGYLRGCTESGLGDRDLCYGRCDDGSVCDERMAYNHVYVELVEIEIK